MTRGTPSGDGLNAAGKTGTTHGQGVQWNIRSTPGIAGWGKIVRVDLTLNLENLDQQLLRQGRSTYKPVGGSPGFNNLPGQGIGFSLSQHLIKSLVNQSQAGQSCSSPGPQLGVIKSGDQRGNIVASHHSRKQIDGSLGIEKR